MSVGTSNTTVISPITTEAHNLNTTIVSAASRDDGSPANLHGNTVENRQNSIDSRPTGQFLFLRFRPLLISRVLLPFSCVCVVEGRDNRETERQSDTVT